MSEVLSENSVLTGPEMVQLIARRLATLRAGWELREQRARTSEELAKVIGEQAILGQKFSLKRLSPETRQLIRQRGELSARITFNNIQLDLIEEDTEARLTGALDPKEGEAPKLIITPRGGIGAIRSWDTPHQPEQTILEARFKSVGPSGRLWVEAGDDQNYDVDVFDKQGQPLVDIEIVYPKPE